ncbi:MAG: sodium:calcium antiporter [Acidobacteriota bacterium]|nr:sodium:calcium antiporter [Acidobacteriota bacterium]
MISTALWLVVVFFGAGCIVWGAEEFAEHLAAAGRGLGASTFALALLLAGAEPEELATCLTASARKLPAIAVGDVIGANITACLLALGVGALVAPLPFGRKVFRYALLGLPLGAIGVWFAWAGVVSRAEGVILVLLYCAYIAIIWFIEKKSPSLGEAEELGQRAAEIPRSRKGREILHVFAGVAAMIGGSMALVEGLRQITPAEPGQATLGLTVVGFATGFELVVLAWSTARRGASEASIAAVIGSYAYNMTMTLGAAALVRPLVIRQAGRLQGPFLMMLGSLVLVIVLAIPNKQMGRAAGALLIVCYVLFIGYVLWHAHII